MKKEFENYTPKIFESYAKVVVKIIRCGTCRKPMLDIQEKHFRRAYIRTVFPGFYRDQLEGQMKRAGIVFRSDLEDKEGVPICVQCAKEGKSTFVCSLCNQERSSNQVQESYGYPFPDYLCKVCYTTVVAAVWLKKEGELEEKHRWDYE